LEAHAVSFEKEGGGAFTQRQRCGKSTVLYYQTNTICHAEMYAGLSPYLQFAGWGGWGTRRVCCLLVHNLTRQLIKQGWPVTGNAWVGVQPNLAAHGGGDGLEQNLVRVNKGVKFGLKLDWFCVVNHLRQYCDWVVKIFAEKGYRHLVLQVMDLLCFLLQHGSAQNNIGVPPLPHRRLF